jgi:hypothetical protein
MTIAERLVLAVELDVLEETPAGSGSDPIRGLGTLYEFAAYTGKCGRAAYTVMNNAGIPLHMEMRVSKALHEGDIQYFASNVQRTHRIRQTSPDEYLRILAPRSNHAVIRQVAPGIRVLCPISFVAKTAAIVEAAEAKRRFAFLDRDDVLTVLFDTVCASAVDATLDVDVFIAGALLSNQFMAEAHALAPERRPS